MILVVNQVMDSGWLTGDRNTDEGLAHLDGFLYHEAHVIGTVGCKVHRPASTVDEETNRELLITATACRSDNVQSETVFTKGGRTLIGTVLNKVSILHLNKFGDGHLLHSRHKSRRTS